MTFINMLCYGQHFVIQFVAVRLVFPTCVVLWFFWIMKPLIPHLKCQTFFFLFCGLHHTWFWVSWPILFLGCWLTLLVVAQSYHQRSIAGSGLNELIGGPSNVYFKKIIQCVVLHVCSVVCLQNLHRGKNLFNSSVGEWQTEWQLKRLSVEVEWERFIHVWVSRNANRDLSKLVSDHARRVRSGHARHLPLISPELLH